jgi:membrane protein
MAETNHVRTGRVAASFVSSMLKTSTKMAVRSGAGAAKRAAQEPARQTDDRSGEASPTNQRAPEHGLVQHAKSFVNKFGKDWCMNLAGLLAYNFLGATFPLLLGILAIGALFLPPSLLQSAGGALNSAIPSAANGANGLNLDFNEVLTNFRKASGLTAIISFVALLWTGSSLFGVMENCFSLIYRTKDRSFIWQKLMSLVMIVIFAVLTPLSFVASTVSASLRNLTQGLDDLPGSTILVQAAGFVIGVIFAVALFTLIYVIVPNLKLSWSHAWRGAVVAGVLFEAASLLFPVYASTFGGKSQFGAVAGLLAVLTLWFWVISLILLIGAEVNSYVALGQRATDDDLPGILHGMKVHREQRAGRDASSPQQQERIMEDVQPAEEKKRTGRA